MLFIQNAATLGNPIQEDANSPSDSNPFQSPTPDSSSPILADTKFPSINGPHSSYLKLEPVVSARIEEDISRHENGDDRLKDFIKSVSSEVDMKQLLTRLQRLNEYVTQVLNSTDTSDDSQLLSEQVEETEILGIEQVKEEKTDTNELSNGFKASPYFDGSFPGGFIPVQPFRLSTPYVINLKMADRLEAKKSNDESIYITTQDPSDFTLKMDDPANFVEDFRAEPGSSIQGGYIDDSNEDSRTNLTEKGSLHGGLDIKIRENSAKTPQNVQTMGSNLIESLNFEPNKVHMIENEANKYLNSEEHNISAPDTDYPSLLRFNEINITSAQKNLPLKINSDKIEFSSNLEELSWLEVMQLSPVYHRELSEEYDVLPSPPQPIKDLEEKYQDKPTNDNVSQSTESFYPLPVLEKDKFVNTADKSQENVTAFPFERDENIIPDKFESMLVEDLTPSESSSSRVKLAFNLPPAPQMIERRISTDNPEVRSVSEYPATTRPSTTSQKKQDSLHSAHQIVPIDTKQLMEILKASDIEGIPGLASLRIPKPIRKSQLLLQNHQQPTFNHEAPPAHVSPAKMVFQQRTKLIRPKETNLYSTHPPLQELSFPPNEIFKKIKPSLFGVKEIPQNSLAIKENSREETENQQNLLSTSQLIGKGKILEHTLHQTSFPTPAEQKQIISKLIPKLVAQNKGPIEKIIIRVKESHDQKVSFLEIDYPEVMSTEILEEEPEKEEFLTFAEASKEHVPKGIETPPFDFYSKGDR